jgi:hypothetical protein
MDLNSKLSKFRIAIITILLITTGLSCNFLSGSSTSSVPKDQNSSSSDAQENSSQDQNSSTTEQQAPAATRASIPDGWKVTKDSTGTCQVATPPGWQLGVDFFLRADKADPGPFEDHPGKFPPRGEALWKDNPGLQGDYYQDRRTLLVGELVCSVWRIQADVEFSSEQQKEMDQVGKTLEEVQ